MAEKAPAPLDMRLVNKLTKHERQLDDKGKREVQDLLFNKLGLANELSAEVKKENSEFLAFLEKNKEISLIAKFNAVKSRAVGINTKIDGDFGSSTRLAIAYFQYLQTGKAEQVDGVWGPKTADLAKSVSDTKTETFTLAKDVAPLQADKKVILEKTRKEGLMQKGQRPALDTLVIEEEAFQIQDEIGKDLDAAGKKELRETGNKDFLEKLPNKTEKQTEILNETKATETAKADASKEMFDSAIGAIEKGDVDIMALFSQLEGFEEMVKVNVDGDGLFNPAAWMQAVVNLFSEKSNKTEAEIKSLLGDKLEKEVNKQEQQKQNVLSAMEKIGVTVEAKANGLAQELVLFAVFGYLTLFRIRLWQNGVEEGTNRKDVANLINWVKTTGAENDDFDPKATYGDNLEDLTNKGIGNLQKLETATTFLLRHGTEKQHKDAVEKLEVIENQKREVVDKFIKKYGATAEVARKELFGFMERMFSDREDNNQANEFIKTILDEKAHLDTRVNAIKELNTILERERAEDTAEKMSSLGWIGRELNPQEAKALEGVLGSDKTYERVRFETKEGEKRIYVQTKEAGADGSVYSTDITGELEKLLQKKQTSISAVPQKKEGFWKKLFTPKETSLSADLPFVREWEKFKKEEVTKEDVYAATAEKSMESQNIALDATLDWKNLSEEYKGQIDRIITMSIKLGISEMNQKRLLGVLDQFGSMDDLFSRYPAPETIKGDLSTPGKYTYEGTEINADVKKWLNAVLNPETYWSYYVENVLDKEGGVSFDQVKPYKGGSLNYVHASPITDQTTIENLKKESPDGKMSSMNHILKGIAEHYKLYLTSAEFEAAFAQKKSITFSDELLKNSLNTSRKSHDDKDGYSLEQGDELWAMPHNKEYTVLGTDNKYHNIKIEYKIYLRGKCGNPVVVPQFAKFSDVAEPINLRELDLNGITAIPTTFQIPIGIQVWSGLIGLLKGGGKTPAKPDPVPKKPPKPIIKNPPTVSTTTVVPEVAANIAPVNNVVSAVPTGGGVITGKAIVNM